MQHPENATARAAEQRADKQAGHNNYNDIGKRSEQYNEVIIEKLIAALIPITSRVRTDITAAKWDGRMSWRKKEPLTQHRMRQHLNGGTARGVCPIKAGENTTKLALLDFDSHHGETPWSKMVEVVQTIATELKQYGMKPVFFRSSGGKGIHLFVVWDVPQDAYSVRKLLIKAIGDCGYSNGTGGVANQQIEIFPKQDSVPAYGYGNMFILPLTGKSVPLEPVLNLEPMDKEYAVALTWIASSDVPIAEHPTTQRRDTSYTGNSENIEKIHELLSYISPDEHYDDWVKIGMAIHHETGGSDEGLMIFDEWSSKGSTYQGYEEIERKWDSFHNDRQDHVTIGTLIHMAKQSGLQPNAIGPEVRTVHAPTLQGKPVPERKWIIKDWLPAGYVTALYGDGGVGKSLLAMQMLTCIARDIPFLGLETKKMKVFGVFCEDSEDELHRRQAEINAHYFIDFSDLENVQWQSRVGHDSILIEFLREGHGSATAAYNALRNEVLRTEAQFIVIDTAADTFGGNENTRPQVRQFINLLGRLALEIDGAVLLCVHPSVAGLMRNDGTGGSTAWNNTVRSRLYLSRPRANGEELNEADAQCLRELTKMKANYSSLGDKFILRWCDGAFRIEQGLANDVLSRLERERRNKDDNEIFLLLLDQLSSQGRNVSHSKNAGTYAPKVMITMDRGKQVGTIRLAAAMLRLFDDNIIDVGVTGKDAHRKKKEGVRRRPL